MIRYLVCAGRRLTRAPGFLGFAIVSLSVGIGITTTAYSVIAALFGGFLGYDGSGLVFLTSSSARNSAYPLEISFPDLTDLADQQRTFEEVAAWADFTTGVVGTASGRLVNAQAVTCNYFRTLGIRPELGRMIDASDCMPGAAAVVVLAEPMWRSQFGADIKIVGTTIKIANHPIEVVGVAPVGFRGASAPLIGGISGWVPLQFTARLEGPTWSARFNLSSRSAQWLHVVARPSGKATIETAKTDVSMIAGRLDQAEPFRGAVSGTGGVARHWSLAPVNANVALSGVPEVRLAVIALPALVLLIACTNLANLVLSRGVSHRYEFAVRAALGASRMRMIVELMSEVLIVALVSGFLGLLVADGILTWTAHVLSEHLDALELGPGLAWHLEPGILGAAGAATILSWIVVGLVPALRLTKSSIVGALSAAAGRSVPPNWRGRSNLIALQVAASVALSLLTVTLARSLPLALKTDVADTVSLKRVAVAFVPFISQQYGDAKAVESIRAILQAVRDIPGVQSVAAGSYAPLPLPWLPWPDSHVVVTSESQMQGSSTGSGTRALIHSVTSDFFRTLSLPLKTGRLLNGSDESSSVPVAVLEEGLAHQIFGMAPGIGRLIFWRQERRPINVSASGEATVVGIIADEPSASGQPTRTPIAYVPFGQRYQPFVTFLVRTEAADARPVVGLLSAAIRKADPDLAVQSSGRADIVIGGRRIVSEFIATCTGILATIALGLAMVGLFGVLSQVLEMRKRDLGVRVALGATERQILRLVLVGGLRPVLEGTLVGLAFAFVVGRVLQANATAILTMTDGIAYMVTILSVFVVTAVPCYVLAIRAARVDPTAALRQL